MNDLNTQVEEPFVMRKTPFYKKKGWKISFSVVGVALILLVSFGAYAIATGSKIFDSNFLGGAPFFGAVTGAESLKGEGDGRVNILFMGMGGASHPGGKLTDSMMVVSIDPINKSAAMLSLPRDLFVPISGQKTSTKLNEVYKIGETDKSGTGPDLVKKTVGDILDLPIHYYISIDFEGFTKTIDKLGGIDIYVDKTIDDKSYPADDMIGFDPFYIKAGQHHLDGKTALKYARSRHTSSDFDRAERQQKIIVASKERALSLGFLANPKKVLDMINIVGSHLRTDFTPGEIKTLVAMSNDFTGDIANKVLTNGNDGPLVDDSSSGAYRLIPRDKSWGEVQRIAHEIFDDPYLEKEDAKIEVLNGSKIAGQALGLSQTLKSYGYNVIAVDNSKEVYKKTIIYDYTNGKKEFTLKFLKDRVGVDIIRKADKVGSSEADITIVIGEEYEEVK